MGSFIGDKDEQYFIWLSDLHLDPHYATPKAFQASYYADANCSNYAAPSMGTYGCDSPRELVRSALDHAVNITTAVRNASPAFVIVTGDIIRHGVDQLFTGENFAEGAESMSDPSYSGSVEQAAESSFHVQAMDAAGNIHNEVVSLIETAFPDTEIIYSVGNNDVVPDYYLKLEDQNTPPGNSTLKPESAGMLGRIFDALSTSAEPKIVEGQRIKSPNTVLTSSDQSTFLQGGYYHRNIHNGALAVLSINTVLYSSSFQPGTLNEDDPGFQFAWMRKILLDCVGNGTNAVIVGHIPPAVGSFRHTQLWAERYIKTYYEIVKEFDGIIVAQLFGHLHSDEFRVGLAEKSDFEDKSMIPHMSTPLLLGPSITPLHGNDPSFRLVKYSKSPQSGKYQLLDYESHRCSLETNRQWSMYYTFSEAYGTQEKALNSETFRTIVNSMRDNLGMESSLLKSYRSFILSGATGNGSGNGRGSVECGPDCRDEYLCTLQSATRAGYDVCLLEKPHLQPQILDGYGFGESWIEMRRAMYGKAGVVVFLVVLVSFLTVRRVKQSKIGSASPTIVDENKQTLVRNVGGGGYHVNHT